MGRQLQILLENLATKGFLCSVRADNVEGFVHRERGRKREGWGEKEGRQRERERETVTDLKI